MGFNNDGSAAVAAKLTGAGTWLVVVVVRQVSSVLTLAKPRWLISIRRWMITASRCRPWRRLLIIWWSTLVARTHQVCATYRLNRRCDRRWPACARKLNAQRPDGCPLLLKIAPDLSEAGIDAAVDVALETACDGIIATNTTIGRNDLQTPKARIDDIGIGGLSGQPVRQLSLQVLRHVARRVDQRVPIVGVGGIDQPMLLWEKICAGASLFKLTPV